MDAEAYIPELVSIYHHLSSLISVRLGEHAYVTDGQHGYHIVDDQSDIRHLTAQCIDDWFIDDSRAERLALETHQKNLRSSCEVGDVLLSTAGTLGKAAIITSEVLPANMDQDVARIHMLTDEIDPWYLVAFMNSSVGKSQSDRASTGQVQRHIALGKIRDFLIPINVDQPAVSRVVKKAHESRRAAESLFAQAEGLLTEELQLDGLDLQYEQSYTAYLTAFGSLERLDAEYYQPKYERLLKHIQDTGQASWLGDHLTTPVRRGVLPEYVEHGDVLIINSQHVGKTHIELGENRFTSSEFLNRGNNSRAAVQPYDVLLNSTGYITIGRCQVLLEDILAMVDGHVSIIRPTSGLDPVYLSVFLNSLPGQLQTERGWTGSSGQIELRPETIARYTIWKAPYDLQQEIRALVEQSHEVRKEARQLLDEAKRRVEQMILGV